MKTRCLLLLLFLFSLESFALEPLLLKNGREIFASYSRITGISDRDPELRELLRLNMSRLPSDGNPAELSNSVVLATTELGGAFCRKTIDREAQLPYGQRVLFPDVDFRRGPNQFDVFLSDAINTRLAQVFWQRDPSTQEKSTLRNLMINVAGRSSQPDQTNMVLQVLCGTYASSLSFLVK